MVRDAASRYVPWYTFNMEHPVCPECHEAMHPVRVSSHYGQPFEVDQCTLCGGSWFDVSEQHRVFRDDVAVLDPYDESLLSYTRPAREGLACPKDQAPLRRFLDPQFPKNITIDTCDRCGGLWFNRGEYVAYRKYFHRFSFGAPKSSDVGQESRVQKLTRSFLHIQYEHEKHERAREIKRTISSEALKSLVAFLLARPASATHTVLFSLYRSQRCSRCS